MTHPIEEAAETALERVPADMIRDPRFLCAVIRRGADKLAERTGHDTASRELAGLARRHAEKAARKGVRW
jgi:hypothetical protein